jgi:hypothetical protein
VNWAKDSEFRNWFILCFSGSALPNSIGYLLLELEGGLSHRPVATVDVLHVGECDTGALLPRII